MSTETPQPAKESVIGPHWAIALKSLPLGLLGIPLALIGGFWPELTGFFPDKIRHGLAEIFWMSANYFLVGGVLLVAGAVIHGMVVYATTKYVAREDVIIVRKGIIFRYANSIRLQFATDIDMERTIFDKMMGYGTLVIFLADKRANVKVPFVPDVESVRDYALERAAKMRALNTVL